MVFSTRYTVFSLLFFLQPAVAASPGPWGFGAELSVVSDDNVTRAPASAYIREDTATRIRLDARYSLDFSQNRALIFTGHLLDERYRDFDGLSSLQAGLEAEYRFRTRAGFTAPVYSFFVSSTRADYETDIRDGDTLEYGFRVRRRFTDLIAGAFGAAQIDRSADGEVFNLEQTRYFAHLDYQLTNRFQAYLAYYIIDGDTYSILPVQPGSNPGPGPGSGGGDFYDAVEWDPAFSGANPWWAYRFDARTGVLRLGFNIGIDRNNSIDISVDDIASKASGAGGYGSAPGTPGYDGSGGGALRYDATVAVVSYFHRF